MTKYEDCFDEQGKLIVAKPDVCFNKHGMLHDDVIDGIEDRFDVLPAKCNAVEIYYMEMASLATKGHFSTKDLYK